MTVWVLQKMQQYLRQQKCNDNYHNKKKRSCKIFDFVVPADYKVKLKENEKKDKYLDLLENWKKKPWNMKVTFIPIVIGALDTITEGLLKGLEDLEIRGWAETIQTTTLFRLARILRKVLEIWGDLLSLKLQWNTISTSWYENLSRSK